MRLLGRGIFLVTAVASAISIFPIAARAQNESSNQASLSDLARTVQDQTTDETVRRIVERAMAAVALAEADATRKIAEMQVRLNECEARVGAKDSELLALKRDLAAAEKTLAMEREARIAAERKLTEPSQALTELSDSCSRLSVLLHRLTAENAELTERMESLHTSLGMSENAYHEALERAAEAEARSIAAAESAAVAAARVVSAEELVESMAARLAEVPPVQSNDVFRDSYLALEESFRNLEKTNQDLRGKVDAYRHRASTLEEVIRRDSERVVAYQDEHEKLTAEMESIRASWSVVADTIAKLSAENAELRAAAGGAVAERDSAVAALEANRIEIVETMRVVRESTEAIRRARAERDAALAAAAQMPAAPASGGELAALLEKVRNYEIEIVALRAALAAVPETVSGPSVPPTPAASADTGRIAPPLVIAAPEPPQLRRVDFAAASVEELAAIPEIGMTRARAIVWYRENVKPIKEIEDLKFVPGFNDERISALRRIIAAR